MAGTVCLVIALTCVRMSLSLVERRASPPRPLAKTTGETLEVAIIAIAIVFLVIRPFVTQAFYIPSLSMYPTLQANDRILVNRLTYHFSAPQRNDVVVFRAPPNAVPDDPGGEEKDFVKRVIGLPGETVEIHGGVTYINGKVLREPYADEPPTYDMPPFVVPEGSVFVMGDNRNHSNDSHRWGALDRSLLIGKAVLLFWPPSRAGLVR